VADIRGQIIQGNPTYVTPGRTPEQLPQGPTVLQPNEQEGSRFDPSQHANDKLIARDRHAFITTGTEKTGRRSGLKDPLEDGPPRPSLRTINRTISYQQGEALANQDDLSRPYNRDARGHLLGQQDGSVQPIYGGVPGVWQPYGSYAGFTQGPVKGIQSPVEYGSAQDQRQMMKSGPPHGLHSATFPDYAPTIGRYMAQPQMVGARVDRPSNSPIAGQSYSQTVAPQGQSGTVGVQVSAGNPRNVPFAPGSGWRGA